MKRETDNKNIQDIDVSGDQLYRGYSSKLASILFSFIVFGSGIFYVWGQWVKNSVIVDSFFVSLLILATLILIIGLRSVYGYLINQGQGFYKFVMAASDPDERLREYGRFLRSILDFRRSSFSGLVYGIIIGSAPYILNVWNEDQSIKLSLSIFLFVANFVTGIAFYGLIVFVSNTFRFGKMLKVQLWHQENPSTNFLLGANRRITMLASVYISLAITSIIFSAFSWSILMTLYSIFAGIVFLATFILPHIPIAKKLQEEKEKALFEINNELSRVFHKAMEDFKTGQEDTDLSTLEGLLELKEKTEQVQTWQLKFRSIFTGISIIILSAFPIVLQYYLEKN